MDYSGLQMFLELSRALHFLRASRACHVSPSTLSRVVQRLEQETGSLLLERDKRSVRLTPEGTRFAEHARDTLERWQRLQRDLRGGRDKLAGSIAIFASVTACQSFLPELLGAFRGRHPDVRIQLETGYAADALERLSDGRVDVSVAAIPPQLPRGLVARVLLFTPLVFAAPRVACEVERLCHQRPLPWTDLPVVLPASGHARDSADRWFRRRRVAPRVYGEVPGSEAILALVSLGCGVGIVPRLVVDESPLRGKLTVLDADDGGAALGEFRVGVCTQRKKLTSPL
ncbi:MAG TPA: HTH-type transcriptional activator IlvY, partial [Polyangia bacterium]|nr:HTH-type transcriptional activator IlvY [Polyangia bacterium]